MSRFLGYLEGAFARSGDAIFFLDKEGFIDCNEAALRLFGYDSKEEILRLHPGALAPELQPDGRSSLAVASSEMEEAFAKGHVLVEWQHKRKDGSLFPSEVMLVGFTLEGRQAIAATIRDVTRRKHAEDEVVRQREALHQSEKMAALGSLLAGIAHELNNPLAVVVTQAGLLRENSSDRRVVERAEKIEGAADRCARIVRSFLAMARQRPPTRTQVDLRTVINSALDLTVYALRSSGIRVQTDLADDLASIAGDVDQLIQLALNLIVNAQQALRHHFGQRSLTVRASNLAHAVQICFIDSGPGVSNTNVTRIFEPFFTTKAVGEGTGIGLAICQSIVRQHGGTLSYEDTPGGGATFKVLLPFSEGETPRSARNIQPSQQAPGGTVLVVDDEQDITAALKEIISPLVGRVDVALTGREALKLIATTVYDLVITDLRMPELDGPGLWTRLMGHANAPSRIAFVTGDALDDGLQRFLVQTGAQLLEKPFTPAEARRFVQANLELARNITRASPRSRQQP